MSELLVPRLSIPAGGWGLAADMFLCKSAACLGKQLIVVLVLRPKTDGSRLTQAS